MIQIHKSTLLDGPLTRETSITFYGGLNGIIKFCRMMIAPENNPNFPPRINTCRHISMYIHTVRLIIPV